MTKGNPIYAAKAAAALAAVKWKPATAERTRKLLAEHPVEAERMRKYLAGEPFNDGFPEDGEILGRHGGMTPLERALWLIQVYAREERYQKQQQLKRVRAAAKAEEKARKKSHE